MSKKYEYNCNNCGLFAAFDRMIDTEWTRCFACDGEFDLVEDKPKSKIPPIEWTTTPPTKPGVYVVRWGDKLSRPKYANIYRSKSYNHRWLYTLFGEFTYDLEKDLALGLQILSRPLCTDIDAFLKGE